MYAKIIISFALLLFTASTVSSLECYYCIDCDNKTYTDFVNTQCEANAVCIIFKQQLGNFLLTHRGCAYPDKGKEACDMLHTPHTYCRSCDDESRCNETE